MINLSYTGRPNVFNDNLGSYNWVMKMFLNLWEVTEIKKKLSLNVPIFPSIIDT